MSRRPPAPRTRGPVQAASRAPAATTAPRRTGARSGGPTSGPRAGSTRPAARSAATGGAPETDPEEPRTLHLARLISVRALVLGVVLLVAFSVLFPTVRAYLGQRAEIDALAAEVTEAEQAQRDLQTQLDRWDDDAYVAAQARSRLSFVLPGETAYRVIDPEVVEETPVVEGAEAGPSAGPTLPVGGALQPWYTTIWESVQIAGEAPMPDDDDAEADRTGGDG